VSVGGKRDLFNPTERAADHLSYLCGETTDLYEYLLLASPAWSLLNRFHDAKVQWCVERVSSPRVVALRILLT